MNKQVPARLSRLKFKKLLIRQSSISKMVRRNPFKYGRQILPIKEINQVVKQLGLDYNVKKIKFSNLFRSIFHAIVVKKNSYSRVIASSAKSLIGKKFSQLGQVSHVAILDRFNSYDEEKVDALIAQILSGFDQGARKNSQDTAKVRIIDGTSFALSYSRVKDEFLPIGPGRKQVSTKKTYKGIMKLGLCIQAGNFMPLDWRFSDEYDDNQIFRDLVDWSKPGFIYVIDRGNVAVDYLKKFSDNKIYFIQETWDSHTFLELDNKKYQNNSRIMDRFVLRREIIGWITRSDGTRLKVRRIVAFDEKHEEILSLTTNDFDSSPVVIIKRHARRWEVEVVFDWIKNTLGPNNNHKLTQWSKIKGLRNLIRIWFAILGILLAFAHKKFGTRWWKPQRFSMGEIILNYENLMTMWLEAKLGLRQRDSNISR